MPHSLPKLLSLFVGAVGLLAACGPTPERVCAHVIDTSIKSTRDAARAQSKDERAAAIEACVGNLEQDRSALGEEAFERKLACLMKAPDLPSMFACEAPDKAPSPGE